MDDMVIIDIMYDVIIPQERYPESFSLISLLKVCQEGWVKKGVFRVFSTRDRENRVIHYVMVHLGRPQGSYPENFVALSLFLAEI